MTRPGGGRRLAVVLAATLVLSIPGTATSAAAPASDPGPTVAPATGEGATAGGGRLAATELALTGPGAVTDRTERSASKGWAATVAVPRGTSMVDLTWAERAAPGTVQIRAATREGGWTSWQELESEPDEGPDRGGNGRTGVGPLFLGSQGTDQVEVRVTDGSLPDLRLDAMRWIPGPVTDRARATGPTTRVGGPGGPVIHPRSEWAPGGWRVYPGCTKAPETMAQLRFVVIHHTVNANTYKASDVPGILAGIYRYHTTGRHWCDVAYNFFVDRFGGVWQGRSGAIDVPIMGGHAKGFNTDSMGVALLGQHESGASPTSAPVTPAALASVRALLTWKLAIHGLDPQGKVRIVSNGSTRYRAGRVVTLPVIQGHIDSSMTDCPGDRMISQLAALRAGVAADLAAAADPQPWTPFPSGPAFFSQVWRDARGRPATNTQAASATSKVVRDGRSTAEVTAEILVSAVVDDRIGLVDRYHVAFTGRHPDTATLARLISRRDAGAKIDAIAAELATTPEFRTRWGTSTPAALSTTAYRRLLGRDPTSAEQADNVRLLSSGMTRAAFVARVAGSREHALRQRGDSAVVDVWFGLLQQAPDAATLARWRGRFADGRPPVDAVALVLASPGYQARFPIG